MGASRCGRAGCERAETARALAGIAGEIKAGRARGRGIGDERRKIVDDEGIGEHVEASGEALRCELSPAGSLSIIEKSDGVAGHEQPRQAIDEDEAITGHRRDGIVLQNNEARIGGGRGGVGENRKPRGSAAA
jgi:hypothetical protein